MILRASLSSIDRVLSSPNIDQIPAVFLCCFGELCQSMKNYFRVLPVPTFPNIPV